MVAIHQREQDAVLDRREAEPLPLIRYELTDELALLTEPHTGPWTGRRISEVQGRLDDHFIYADGVDVHPHLFRSALAGVP